MSGAVPSPALTPDIAGATAAPGVGFSDEKIAELTGSVGPSDLAGSYRFADGFWEWEIHLLRDGKFGVVAMTDELETAADGSVRRHGILESKGAWNVENGSAVRLKYQSTAGGSSDLVFTVVTVGGRLALQEPRFRPYLRRIYVRVQDPQTRYVEKDQRVLSPEATPAEPPQSPAGSQPRP